MLLFTDSFDRTKNRQLIIIIAFLTTVSLSFASKFEHRKHINSSNTSHHAYHIEVAGWHWKRLSTHISIGTFVLAICVIKILYHKVPRQCKFFTTSIPESNILIIVGLIAGIFVYFIKGSEFKNMHWSLHSQLFFFILLPPIMLEAAYSLYDRDFLNNLTSIVYFAVVGTVLNCLIIGFSLYALSLTSVMGEPKLNLTVDTSLLFSSIVVAVDPVAVLAIFNEIGVQVDLYYIVFGESLFNDAVTVVLYKIFNAFNVMKSKSPLDLVLGLISFFTVSFGGLLIGVLVGALCSFISRFTAKTRIVEPMMIFTSAFLSYYVADLIGWSGIMAIISCGIMQAAYCFDNISRKSKTTVKYFSKVMASVSEGIIFLFLGVELVTKEHYWHWGFALCSLTLCIIVRFLVVFISSIIQNFQHEEKSRSYGEMFIIAFGGLRGAVAFALADTLNRQELSNSGIDKDLFVTSTLFIIMFTCFVMGHLIKPAVRLMNIRMKQTDHQLSVFFELNNHVMDHIGTAVEDITGNKGKHYFRVHAEYLSEKYIRPCLQRKVHRHVENIIDIYHKVALEIHLATVQLSTTDNDKKQRTRITDKLAENLKKQIDEFSGSPEEFQQLTRPNYLQKESDESTVLCVENNEESEITLKELRAAIKVMTLATPSRRMSTSTYHERVNRIQQSDDNISLTEDVHKLQRFTMRDAQNIFSDKKRKFGIVGNNPLNGADYKG